MRKYGIIGKGIVAVVVIFLISYGYGVMISGASPKAEFSVIPDKAVYSIGEKIKFDASKSEGNDLIYYWHFHDGTKNIEGSNKVSVTHAFTKAGVYYVTLFVQSSNGKMDMCTKKIVVKNSIPHAVMRVSSKSVYEGEYVIFNGTESYDPDGDPITWQWYFGDGTTGNGSVVMHRYFAPGNYTVRLIVKDKYGAFSVARESIQVENKRPAVKIIAPDIAYEDECIEFYAGVNDTVNDLKSLRCEWDFGDGTNRTGLMVNHTYTKCGTYNVSCVIIDNNGAIAKAYKRITVYNVPPTTKIVGRNITLKEGQCYIFRAVNNDTYTDKPLLNTTWSFGGWGAESAHAWADDWSGWVSETTKDDDSATDTSRIYVTVKNVPPHVVVDKVFVKLNLTVIYHSCHGAGEAYVTIYEGNSLKYQLELKTNTWCSSNSTTICNLTMYISKPWFIKAYVPSAYGHLKYVLRFDNGAVRCISHRFGCCHNVSKYWNITLNRYLFAEGCCYDMCHNKNPALHMEINVFDPGKDRITVKVNYGDGYTDWYNYTPNEYPVRLWKEFVHIYEDHPYNITVTAIDDDGGIDEYILHLSENGSCWPVAPAIYAGNNTEIHEDSYIAYNCTVVNNDSVTGEIKYEWNFGDGNLSNCSSGFHKYDQEGRYLVIVKVYAGDVYAEDGYIVTVKNVKPYGEIHTSPSSAYEDENILFTACGADTAGDLKSLKYSWDFGDGSKGAGMEVVHNYTHPGIYTITLKIEDNNGAIAEIKKRIKIYNRIPELIVPKNITIYGSEMCIFNVSAKDSPSDIGCLRYYWSVGTANYRGLQFHHMFTLPGTYRILFRVVDDDGATSNATVYVDVKPGSVLLYGGTAMDIYGPSTTIRFCAEAYDEFYSDDDLSYRWDFGDGNNSEGAVVFHKYAEDGIYTVSLTVKDPYGVFKKVSFVVAVTIDSDADSVSDALEKRYGTNAYRWDSDGDSVADYYEIFKFGTDPTESDSDGDGAPDWFEISYMGYNNDTDGDGIKNPYDIDSDGDLIPDGQEIRISTNGNIEFLTNPLIYNDVDYRHTEIKSYDALSEYNNEVSVIVNYDHKIKTKPTIVEMNDGGYSVMGPSQVHFTAELRVKLSEDEIQTLKKDPDIYRIYYKSADGTYKMVRYGGADTVHGFVWCVINYWGEFKVLNTKYYDTDNDGLSDYYELKHLYDVLNYSRDEGIADSIGAVTRNSNGVWIVEGSSDIFLKSIDENMSADMPLYLTFKYRTSGTTNAITLRLEEYTNNTVYTMTPRLKCDGAWHTAKISLWQIPYTYTNMNESELLKKLEIEITMGGEKVLYIKDLSIKGTTSVYSTDTDGDGLSDYREVMGKIKTNPLKKDTDGDGLIDSNEFYTKVKELPRRIYFNGTKDVEMAVREDPYSLGLKNASLVIELRADNNSKISYEVWFGGTYLGSGNNINNTKCITENITAYVNKDIEYAKLEVSGRGWIEMFKAVIIEKTDPTKWDTDGDGLSDGAEINGTYGYITDPLKWDTDSDGISDYMEEYGWRWQSENNEYVKELDKYGFHTNPLCKDTDGDGVSDSLDADPLHNIVVKMTDLKYTYSDHPDYTKFVGFYCKWTYGDLHESVKYFTKHKNHIGNLKGYHYWFDVGDYIGTHIEIKVAAFSNAASNGGDYEVTSIDYTIVLTGHGYYSAIIKSVDENHYDLQAEIDTVGLSRVHTIAVYNESVFKDGRYCYKGRYYLLYVQSDSNEKCLRKGLNVIIIPEELFVYSELYKKIKSGDISYLKGSDPDKAKMGAIGNKSSWVHIVGMFFFKGSGYDVEELLELVLKNETGKKFARYAAIEPESANLPVDVLRAIPYEPVENSKTGDAPKNLWQQIVSRFTNLVIGVANFIKNGLIAIGEFIIHADIVVTKFFLNLFKTAANTVQNAVEVIKKVVDSLLSALKNILMSAINNLLSPLIKAFEDYKNGLKKAIVDIITGYRNSGKLTQDMIQELNKAIMQPFFYGMLALGMGIWVAITLVQGLSLGMGTFIVPLVGVAVMAVMENVFKDNNKYGKIGLPKPSLDFGSVWSGIEKFLHQKPVENFMMSLLEALISTVGFIFSLPAVSEVAGDASGTSAAMLSFITGFFSVVVSYVATALSPIDYNLALGAGSLGVALGIESVALGVIGLRNTEINGNVVLSLIGMGFSAVSIIMFLTLR